MFEWYQIILLIVVILAVFFLTVMVIDGNRFVIREYRLNSNKLKKNHRFAVLSDLHNKSYGKNNEKLLKAIDEIHPEGILIAGDILTAKPEARYDVALELVKELAKKYPVYYGMGNHETRLFLYPEKYGDMGQRYEEALKQAGVELMKNTDTECEDNIHIVGLDMLRDYYKRFQKMPMKDTYLKEQLGEAQKEKYEILLAHNPDYFEEYAAWGADLSLAGHLHGGVMRLPFLGGVVSPALGFFPKYDGGLFHIGKAAMIVSRGLGMHTIPIRIFNPGELIVLTLEPEKQG